MDQQDLMNDDGTTQEVIESERIQPVDETKAQPIKINDPMSQSLFNLSSETSRWQPKYPFDLVITYEDDTTRTQAVQLYDHLAQTLLDDYDFQCAWWRFDHFRNPNLREQAVDAAAEANMIIICLRSGEKIPQVVRSWIDDWLPRKDKRKSALVTLVGGVEQTRRDFCPANTYLQGIAKAGRMDFFSHAFESAKVQRAPSPAEIEQVQFVFEEMSHSPSETPRWGINE